MDYSIILRVLLFNYSIFPTKKTQSFSNFK